MSRIRVLFDSEIFVRQNFGGISRYFSELYQEFRNDPSLQIEPLLGFKRNSNTHLKESLKDSQLNMPPLRTVFPGLPRLMNGSEFAKNAFLTYRAGTNPYCAGEIFHATYLRPRATDQRRAKVNVVTIHDMIPEQLGLPRNHPARRGKAEVIEASDFVITISNFTAQIVQDHWPRKPIRVIPHGVNSRFSSPNTNPIGIPPFPYVLFVGGRSGYKNFSVLPAAMKILSRERDMGLVCVGNPFSRSELEELRFLSDRNRLLQLRISEEQLPHLYRNSVAFVFSSMMEGFGLPVLEAAASGCPVVLSDIPVFREQANDWAEFFEPTSSEALACGLQSVVDSPGRGVAPAAVRSNLPTWKSAAINHAQVYETVTGGNFNTDLRF